MRKILDRLYQGSGALASLLIAAICVLVCTQVLFNLITRIGGRTVNLTIPSYGDFAGYFLAASSFLALAYTLTRGGHIRVNLILSRLPTRLRFIAEVLSTAVCTMVSVYATYFMAKLCLESYEYQDLSTGIIAIPIWIPQTVVLIGMSILCIALTDILHSTFTNHNSHSITESVNIGHDNE